MSQNKVPSYQAYHDRGARSSDGTSPPNSPPSECDALIPMTAGRDPLYKPSGMRVLLRCIAAMSVLSFVIYNLGMHLAFCPLFPWTMMETRRGWEKAVADHERLQKQWVQEEQAHADLEQDWKLEAEWHEREVARRMHQEWERQERVRKEWAEEYARNARELQELRRRENQQREVKRQRWRREVAEHDRIEEERRRREEEERQKLNMFWGRIETHGCITYGTREYTAVLMNMPVTWRHRVEACKVTPLEVHGISHLPKSCEDKGPGVVIGHWEVSQHQLDCAPFWLYYKDKGCTSVGSGKRRIEHYLENLPKGGDWREFCATTPAYFRGMKFDGAHECFQYNGGTYGHWEIDDADCSAF